MGDHPVILKYDGFMPKPETPENITEDAGLSTSSTLALYRVKKPEKQPDEKDGKESRLIVLLMDISGSMTCEMDTLQAAISSTVRLILDREVAEVRNIALVPFHSHAEVHRNFGSVDELLSLVWSLEADGGTCYGDALNTIPIFLEKQPKECIVVMFSDGAPMDTDYESVIQKLKYSDASQSLLFHAIGLKVSGRAEDILRNLTTIGFEEGFYQSIDDTEIEASMNVLLDHFKCGIEANVNGKRTRTGFFVGNPNENKLTVDDRDVPISDIIDDGFQRMLEKNMITDILDAIRYMLEYHIRCVDSFEKASDLVKHLVHLIERTEKHVRVLQKAIASEISEKRNAELNSVTADDMNGAEYLKRRSEIIARYTKQVQNASKECSAYISLLYDLKELSAQIREKLYESKDVSVSGEVMKAISQFRDNFIAQKRKHIARFSSKVRDKNIKFADIDGKLDREIDQLVQKLQSSPISPPMYLIDYKDPFTLNNFEEILLHKYGVFMLLLTVERHDYGITAPHRTKIVEIGGYNANVLDVMMNNKDKSLLFDFRGIGYGNAAVPLWINEVHWSKARHVFGPFIGHAVTGNEMEYTEIQGETLLALILIHLRQQPVSEYNNEIINFVSQTLNVVLNKKKWEKVLNNVKNSFENLNENEIPSIEVFFVFYEYMEKKISLGREKALLLVAEAYRRRNKYQLKDRFYKQEKQARLRWTVILYPKLSQKYFDISSDLIESRSLDTRSMESYFLRLCDKRHMSSLVKQFDKFAGKLAATSPVLSKFCSSLNDQQKMAIILSVHKCVCFNWSAVGQVPEGLSFDEMYPDLLLQHCRKDLKKNEKSATLLETEENVLFKILSTSDISEADGLLKNIKRNSHIWGAMVSILLKSCQVDRQKGMKRDEQQKLRLTIFRKQTANMAIPLHQELVMFCIFNSLHSHDWIPEKMIWRPNADRRRRIKLLFPETPEIV